MLQLFVLFFLLPKLDIALPPLVAGVAGLAGELLGLRGRDLPGRAPKRSRQVRWRRPWRLACRGNWPCAA